MIVALIISLLLYGLLVTYISWSGYRAIGLKGNKWFLIAYCTIVLFLSVSFILGRLGNGSIILKIIGNYWMAVFAISLLVLPVIHIVMLISRFLKIDRTKIRVTASIGGLVIILSIIGYGSYMAYTPKVTSYEITIDKPYPEDLSIVMFSDTHFGYLSGVKHAERLVKEVNALQPDLILIPGDIIDDDLAIVEKKGIFEILSDLEARLGVYGSLGNHDKDKLDLQELITAIERSGIDILFDESIVIGEGLNLIGRIDLSTGERLPTEQLTEHLDMQMPLILLDHQPYEYAEALQAGIDLVVSGHTHYGQIAPGNLITGAIYENDWGYLAKDRLHTIVSSGYGFWGPPIRIGSQAEIVEIKVDFVN